ncbi:hypothetical protein ACLD02_08340 [Alloalcanivorax sp. C16-2]|uniref:hypothetical protein n=1 Tax=Alloalcanivorax sp. C16-2 TaxID=3390052 RepID=UPI0039706641
MRSSILVGVLTFFLCSQSQAARQWAFQEIYVKDVLVYNQGGNNVVTVRMAGVPSDNNVGCNPTDAHHIVSFWYDGSINTTVQTWVSVLLSAQAQDLPVDLWVDMNNCSSGSQWNHYGAPYGLGLRLMGVKIAK